MIQWYAIYTHTGNEKRAEIELKERGYEVYLPVETVWCRHSRSKTRRDRPLLVRYLFVGLKVGQSFYQVRSAPGVEKILGLNDGKPLQVPQEFITRLKDAQSQGEFDKTGKPPLPAYVRDQTVRINAGKFTGFTALFVSATTNQRARVLLKGRLSGMLELDQEHLEAA